MKLLHGDCLEVLRGLESDSLDSLVTDPPAGIGFMGKGWDGDKGGRDQWVTWLSEVMRECLRVLKPGAHGLVWAIPRTSHWTALALENAGFEVRDVITHLFGSGFPKSLDISKAIDKAAGAEREVIGVRQYADGTVGHYANNYCMNPTGKEPGTLKVDTAPATDAAKQWQGFGTALKPAAEFWWLVRKPLGEKTVAANVLKHGTGGLNIDGCRIGVAKDEPNKRRDTGGYASGESQATVPNAPYNSTRGATLTTGRFPANLVLSHSEGCETECVPDCAVRMLDEQSGVSRSTKLNCTQLARGPQSKGAEKTRIRKDEGYSDSGGASRFFYVAKASKSDRNRRSRGE